MPDSATLTTESGTADAIRRARSWSTSNDARIALVDADEHRSGVERLLQLRLVVDLDEHVESHLAGELVHLHELERVEHSGDEQDRVRLHQPGVDDVAWIDCEVLAQHGQCRGGAGGLQIVDRPAEELLISEH